MKITITNVGAINSATIHLDSLTVIAGENDTGKSTIGKVIFALVQAYSRFPLAVSKAKKNQVRKLIQRLYFTVGRSAESKASPEMQDVLGLLRSAERFDSQIPLPIVIGLAKIALSSENISLEKKMEVEKILNELNDDFSGDDEIGKYILRALRSEFADHVVSKPLPQDLTGGILLLDKGEEILNIKFTDKRIVSFKSERSLEINDATFIDGPSILQYFAAISDFNEIGEKQIRGHSLPYHSIDLADKLRNVKENKSYIDANQLTELEQLIHGSMKYDRREVDFLFYRDESKIPANNVASGVKALSIMSLLIRGDYIKKDSIVILDEPETNLHPSWQIAYAKLISELVAGGVKVLVASHSPYIVEALKIYSADLDSPKFYLSQRSASGDVVYSDTHGDITAIIAALTKPLAELINNGSDDDFWG